MKSLFTMFNKQSKLRFIFLNKEETSYIYDLISISEKEKTIYIFLIAWNEDDKDAKFHV